MEETLGAKPIRRVRAYVSANHQFELHINGAVVDRGPAFSYPGEGYYQASDITTLLQAGSPVAVGVLYHWYGGGQGRPAGESGLLVRVVVDHDDGTQEVIVSDETWRVARASQWQTGAPRRNGDSGDFVESIDMREAADGWDMPGFDASGWAAPQVIGAHPSGVFSALERPGATPPVHRSAAGVSENAGRRRGRRRLWQGDAGAPHRALRGRVGRPRAEHPGGLPPHLRRPCVEHSRDRPVVPLHPEGRVAGVSGP